MHWDKKTRTKFRIRSFRFVFLWQWKFQNKILIATSAVTRAEEKSIVFFFFATKKIMEWFFFCPFLFYQYIFFWSMRPSISMRRQSVHLSLLKIYQNGKKSVTNFAENTFYIIPNIISICRPVCQSIRHFPFTNLCLIGLACLLTCWNDGFKMYKMPV